MWLRFFAVAAWLAFRCWSHAVRQVLVEELENSPAVFIASNGQRLVVLGAPDQPEFLGRRHLAIQRFCHVRLDVGVALAVDHESWPGGEPGQCRLQMCEATAAFGLD